MKHEGGFNLIELVIFIVVVGVALAGVTAYFTGSVRHAADPVIRERAITVASAYMDEILRKRWHEYAPLGGECIPTGSGRCSGATWQANRDYEHNAWVVPTGGGTHYYRARQSDSGRSGATEPSWPTDGSTVTDNAVTWQHALNTAGTPNLPAGPDGGETRSDYDDLDDYDAINNEAPKDQTGTSMTGDFSNFSVSVDVSEPANDLWGAARQDLRRIEVTVTSPMGESFTLTAYRANF